MLLALQGVRLGVIRLQAPWPHPPMLLTTEGIVLHRGLVQHAYQVLTPTVQSPHLVCRRIRARLRASHLTPSLQVVPQIHSVSLFLPLGLRVPIQVQEILATRGIPTMLEVLRYS